MIIERYSQKQSESLAYDIDFTRWLDGIPDTAASIVVNVSAGLTYQQLAANSVRVWAPIGLTPAGYTANAIMTTAAGRVKEASIVIRVK